MSEEIYEKIVSKIKDNLNIEIDDFSYDAEILKAIADCTSDIDDIANEFMNSYNFETMKSSNLDNFMNFFDIYRTAGNNEDLYSIKLKYISSSQNVINILKNCTVQIENSYYKVLKDTVISEEECILTVQKIFNSNNISEPVYSNKGTLCLDKNYIKSSQDDIILEVELPKNLYVISFLQNVNEKENDFEFLEKSKNIMQAYGYSNEKKIELTLLEDTRIKSLYTITKNATTNIIIFPKKLEELDEIIKYNKYVVDYYKSSNIVLLKPNLFEINISGLMSQLNLLGDAETMLETITNDLKTTLSLLWSESETLTLKRDDLIQSLKKTINNFYLSGEIDYRTVIINYNYYYKNNYNVPIMNNVIDDSEIVKKSDIIVLGSIE